MKFTRIQYVVQIHHTPLCFSRIALACIHCENILLRMQNSSGTRVWSRYVTMRVGCTMGACKAVTELYMDAKVLE